MSSNHDFKTTLGSDVTDDSYYFEYRSIDDPIYSFLSFDINTDEEIYVSIGRGKSSQRMPIELLKQLVKEAEKRLSDSMIDWKKGCE